MLGSAVNDQIPEGVLDAAMKRRVGVHHLLQLGHRDLGVHGEREEAQNLTAVRPGRGGADEHAADAVLDELDEPVVASLVDPPSDRKSVV